MSADDQAFLDVLSSVPTDIKRYSNDVASYIESHIDSVSSTLRSHLQSVLPPSVRPKPPPPPPRSFLPPASTYDRIQTWVSRNKILSTLIVITISGVTYHIIRKNLGGRKKRRAKRAGNGARLEVVVIAGSPSEPIVRSLALDLERRGFIVYIVCHTIEEEVLVQNEGRGDIKSLMVDIVDSESAKASIDRFTSHLQKAHAAVPGARPHHLIFRSLLVIPTTTYPSQPLATLPPSTLSDLLNTRLLTPLLTIQTFLPLLHSLPLHNPHFHSTPAAPIKPSVLVLTPSIISSLSPAFHLPESALVSALTSSTAVLTAELAPLSIPVTHLQLGTFDTSAFSSHNRQLATRAETLRWDDGARGAYARNYIQTNGVREKGASVVGKGSSLRELNDAVFDSMMSRRGGIKRVGMGSSVYGLVGKLPSGLVGWMMGMRGVRDFGVESGKGVVEKKREEREVGDSGYVNVYGNVHEGVYGEEEESTGDKGVDEVLRDL